MSSFSELMKRGLRKQVDDSPYAATVGPVLARAERKGVGSQEWDDAEQTVRDFSRDRGFRESVLSTLWSRRSFLGATAAVGVSLAAPTVFAANKSHSADPKVIAKQFLSGSFSVPASSVPSLLFDATLKTRQEPMGKSIGKATHLGGGVFLSCLHNFELGDYKKGLCGIRRSGEDGSRSEDVKYLWTDYKRDLALLHVSGNWSSKPTISLSSADNSPGNVIHQFIQYKEKFSSTTQQTLKGQDISNETKIVPCCQITTYANTGVLRKSGWVHGASEDTIRQRNPSYNSSIETATSIIGYAGESGQGVWGAKQEGILMLTGVAVKRIDFAHKIRLRPPIRMKTSWWQSEDIFVKSSQVRAFMNDYLSLG